MSSAPEGLAAAWATGSKSGRRPQVAKIGAVDDVRQAFRTGASIVALAREHGVSRGAIRTAVADLLPGQPERSVATAAEPEVVRVEMPGKIARHLHDHSGLGEEERHALQQGRTVRRGQGYSLQVTATPQVRSIRGVDNAPTWPSPCAHRRRIRSSLPQGQPTPPPRSAPRSAPSGSG